MCVCLSTDHETWVGTDESLGPVAVSVRRDRLQEAPSPSDHREDRPTTGHTCYRVIVRCSEVSSQPSPLSPPPPPPQLSGWSPASDHYSPALLHSPGAVPSLGQEVATKRCQCDHTGTIGNPEYPTMRPDNASFPAGCQIVENINCPAGLSD